MRENFRPANFSLMRGNHQKSLGAKSRLYGEGERGKEMGQNLGVLLVWEDHSDLGLLGLAQL